MQTAFEKIKDNPIFIFGYPKSGTTLLMSLLDGHPQLVVFPEELKFERIKNSKDKLDAICNKTGCKVFKMNCFNEGHSGNRDYSNIDFKKFKECLAKKILQLSANDYKSILTSIIETYYEFEFSNKSDKRAWVEKTPRNEKNALFFYRLFGNKMTAIHIRRNPYDNFASYRKKHPRSTIKKFCQSWQYSNYLAEKNKKKIKNYFIVNYEDLVDSPKKVLNGLCAKIGIDFFDILLSPTRNGKFWHGNSMHNKKFNNISADSINRYKQVLTEKEINQISKMSNSKLILFEYILKNQISKFSWKLKTRLPFLYSICKKIINPCKK